MENNGHDKITAFDTLFTTNHIQMLKILMPYFEPSMQKQLVVYIKYLELRYALSCLDSRSHELYGCAGRHGSSPGQAEPFGKEDFNIEKICTELIPYCTNDEKQKIEQISGLFRSIEMYKELSQTMEIMKDFMPDMPADFLSNFMQNSAPDTGPSGTSESQAASRDDASSAPGISGGSATQNRGNDMMDMLMNMLSPEQKAMLEMFGGNQTHESE